MTAIDLKPIVDVLMQDVAAPLVVALATWVGVRLLQMIGINKDSVLGQRLLTAASNGAAAAIAKANTALDQHTTVDVKNQMVADTIAYVQRATPAAIKHLGLDTAAGQAHLETVALAQLSKLSLPAAAAAPTQVTS